MAQQRKRGTETGEEGGGAGWGDGEGENWDKDKGRKREGGIKDRGRKGGGEEKWKYVNRKQEMEIH